jgi:hypothetical protein
MRAVIMDPVPSLTERLPDVSEELDRILQKALAKEAKDRFSTAEELASELERFGRANQCFAKQREVADFMTKVFPEEFSRGPRVDTVPFGASITLDMAHANDSSSSKSYVSQIPGAIRELEVDAGGDGPDIGHLIDAPSVVPLPSPAIQRGSQSLKPRTMDLDSRPGREAARRNKRRGSARKSTSGPKRLVVLLLGLLLVAGGAVAYDQPDAIKEAVGRIEGMFEEKGPPEVAVDENPLLQQHGARILIASSPPGAKVFLDGKEQGVAPVAFTGLMQGDYRVRVEAPGFASWSTTVKVATGETAGVTASLVGKQGGAAPGSFGRVTVETTPPTDVYVAGDLLGRTPMEAVHVPIGRLTFDFELPDGRRVSRKVVVESDRVARARFDLTGPEEP